jgi:hypothetical protein
MKGESKMAQIKFFSLKSKKSVLVDVSKITIETLKNGRKAAKAVDPETGGKLYKFLSKEDLKLFK